MKRLVAWISASLATASVAMAQTAANGDLLSQKVSLMDMLSRGGFVMIVLGLMSVVGLALVIYFFFVLRHSQVVPPKLRDDVLDKLEAGEWSDARSACGYKPCAFSEVVVSAIDCARAADPVNPDMLKDVIEGEGGRQALLIQGQTQYLFDLAVLAPMVGLLGTVFGMIHAFNAVALDLTKAKPMLLAAGVGEALVATAAGLIVGIPTMAFYAWFRNRAARLIAELEVASGQVMNVLLGKRGK